ncbi:serine/threonine protein kinase [Streptomyces spongiicola]|uniref:non-specific serine/threonine protein kinase n=1 Tax=Streptomyces spongiicola TaxID=1690221 RepID=A0ABN5KHC4_9ACTN|nr:serine/threonine-protein kinase [Streptomyces spongiicola]AWK09118.1 serine/threonine protein kinase [Streptomyces spongiicola]
MSAWTVPGYTESREIGSGGSGRVVLAVHDATGTPVAVKYLAERLRRDTAFVRAFRAEARLLSGLDTPHVVRLYEYVECPGGAAIVMELVDGIPLRALLAREGATGVAPALVVLKGSLLGLAAAHRAGVVHRDYKPENVLVAPDGSSKLVDFGIAAGRGSTPGVAGTPSYMAPEQWSGGPASPAADVYAATATFFECVTGRRPYSGENFAELALQHTSAPVPVEGVPAELRPLVVRGMAKAPRERPETAEAFVAELESAACAAAGPDWEERGRGELAALAALLPLLFPSAAAPPVSVSARASTSLGRGRRSGWLRPDPRGLLAASLALVLGLLLVIAARPAGGSPGGTVAEAVATTSAGPSAPDAADGPPSAAPPPTAGSASPSSTSSASSTSSPSSPSSPSSSGSSGFPSASPSQAPPAATGSPSGPAAPPTGPSTAPPGASGRPPAPEPTEPPAGAVTSVSIESLRQTGTETAEATVEVVTDGAGPVRIALEWATAAAKGGPGTPDGAPGGIERSGATRYTLVVRHVFRNSKACYWRLTAAAPPGSGNGGSRQEILTRRCTIG